VPSSDRLRAGASAGAVLAALAAGCAALPAERNQEIVEAVCAAADLPVRLAGFGAEETAVRADYLQVRYFRDAPPAELVLLRFAESPVEQKPYELRSLDTALEGIRAVAEGFVLDTRYTMVGTGHTPPIESAWYRFVEAEAERDGCLCVWHEPLERGGWVYVLKIVAPRRQGAASGPDPELTQTLRDILTALELL
jgi:hypothetical protein